jgi:hypothetical protein
MPNDRRELRRTLFALASTQGGYFTATQARNVGYSHQAQAYHVKAGNWLRVGRALFRLAEWLPDTHDDLRRWTLWSNGGGVVSHETSLSVHGIGEFESPRVHMTVPASFTSRDPAVTLHRAALTPDDIADHTGFSVTTPLRSLIDIAAQRPDEDQLARAIADSHDAGQLTLRQLRARAESVDPVAALYIERAIQRMGTT